MEVCVFVNVAVDVLVEVRVFVYVAVDVRDLHMQPSAHNKSSRDRIIDKTCVCVCVCVCMVCVCEAHSGRSWWKYVSAIRAGQPRARGTAMHH